MYNEVQEQIPKDILYGAFIGHWESNVDITDRLNSMIRCINNSIVFSENEKAIIRTKMILGEEIEEKEK